MSTLKNPPPVGEFWHTEFRRSNVSKYPVQYTSSSKGLIDIEDMATPHLLNAWRKLGGERGEFNANAMTELNRQTIGAMTAELASRGCTYDVNTGRWTIPAPVDQTDRSGDS